MAARPAAAAGLPCTPTTPGSGTALATALQLASCSQWLPRTRTHTTHAIAQRCGRTKPTSSARTQPPYSCSLGDTFSVLSFVVPGLQYGQGRCAHLAGLGGQVQHDLAQFWQQAHAPLGVAQQRRLSRGQQHLCPLWSACRHTNPFPTEAATLQCVRILRRLRQKLMDTARKLRPARGTLSWCT